MILSFHLCREDLLAENTTHCTHCRIASHERDIRSQVLIYLLFSLFHLILSEHLCLVVLFSIYSVLSRVVVSKVCSILQQFSSQIRPAADHHSRFAQTKMFTSSLLLIASTAAAGDDHRHLSLSFTLSSFLYVTEVVAVVQQEQDTKKPAEHSRIRKEKRGERSEKVKRRRRGGFSRE